MKHRRNSIIADDQYQNGVRVGTVMNIYGRYPKNGKHSDCAKNLIFYVIKGSGMIASENQKAGLSAGGSLYLKNCESYYLKGQFSVYVMRV